MRNRIRNYFAEKRQIRKLSLDTLQQLNNFTAALSELAEVSANLAKSVDGEGVKDEVRKNSI